MSYLKDREIWLSSVPTGNPPAGYVWVFIQNGVFVVRDSNGVDKIMASTTGTVTNATSASYVEYSNVADKPALISGSSQVSYTGLSDIPAGIVSGSAQIVEYNVFATTGSNQFDGSQAVTGSLTVTGQVVAQTLNVQQVTSSIVFSSGSNIFGNDLGNTQQFTGSVSVTGSLTVNGAGTFAGALNGTSATFSGALNGTNAAFSSGATFGSTVRPSSNFAADLGTSTFRWAEIWGFALNVTGNITSQVNNISADGAGVVLQGYIDNNLRIAARGSGYNDGARGGLLASTGDFSSSVTANSLLVERTVSRNMLGISSISLPTSGDEEGVAVIKTNSSIWQLSTVGYAADSKGVRFYNNGGTGYTAFEVAQSGGTRFIVNGAGNVGIGATSPATLLNLKSSTTTELRLESVGGTYRSFIGFRTDGQKWDLGVNLNDLQDALSFNYEGTEQIRITSGGESIFSKSVTAQGFNTSVGTVTAATSTWVTIYTISSIQATEGVYNVYAHYNDDGGGMAFTQVLADRTHLREANKSDGTAVFLQLNGRDIQVQHIYGTTLSIQYSVLWQKLR